MYTHTIEAEYKNGYAELEIEYTVSWGYPAKLYGEPCDCYPEEPHMIDEVNVIMLVTIGDVHHRIPITSDVFDSFIDEGDLIALAAEAEYVG